MKASPSLRKPVEQNQEDEGQASPATRDLRRLLEEKDK